MIPLHLILAEYSTAYGTDIIDGGAGTDTVTFTGAHESDCC